MAGRFQPFSYGNTMAQVENIKGARIRNQAGQMQIDEMQTQQANRKKRKDVLAMVEGMPQQITALKEQGLYDEANDLRTQYVNMRKNGMVIAEGMAKNLNEDNWAQARQDLIASGSIEPYEMPTKFSQEWLDNKHKKAKADYKIVTETYGTEDGPMKQDVRVVNGQRQKVGKPYPAWKPSEQKSEKDKTGRGQTGGLKASDSNAIAGGTAALFGGIYDPATNQISGLDPTETKRMAAIVEEAERLFMANPEMGHRQAVSAAARKAGVEIDSLYKPNDPLGLLN